MGIIQSQSSTPRVSYVQISAELPGDSSSATDPVMRASMAAQALFEGQRQEPKKPTDETKAKAGEERQTGIGSAARDAERAGAPYRNALPGWFQDLLNWVSSPAKKQPEPAKNPEQ